MFLGRQKIFLQGNSHPSSTRPMSPTPLEQQAVSKLSADHRAIIFRRYSLTSNGRMIVNNEVESILQGIIVAYFEGPSVYFPGHGEGNDASYIDSRFPGRASNLSLPE
jgi:hypothetical protein